MLRRSHLLLLWLPLCATFAPPPTSGIHTFFPSPGLLRLRATDVTGNSDAFPGGFPLHGTFCDAPPGTLPQWLMRKLDELGLTEPTDVQRDVLAAALPPSDDDGALLIISPTGTGKTLSYLLPLLSRLNVDKRSTQAVVLVPTRELVVQVTWEMRRLASGFDSIHTAQRILVVPVVLTSQSSFARTRGWMLKDPPHVVVATPESLAELLNAANPAQWKRVSCVVVDEVDQCIKEMDEDLNFVLGRVLSKSFDDSKVNPNHDKEVSATNAPLNEPRLTLFTSATMSSRNYFLKAAVKKGWVGSASKIEYINAGNTIDKTVDLVMQQTNLVMPPAISHSYIRVPLPKDKLKYLRSHIKRSKRQPGGIVIFMREDRPMLQIASALAKDLKGFLFQEDLKVDGSPADRDVTVTRMLMDAGVVVSVLSSDDTMRSRQSAVEVFKGEMDRRIRRSERKKWSKQDGDDEELGAGDYEVEEPQHVGESADETYKASTLRILIAAPTTSSRGIDCLDCHTVYNFDLPGDGDEYVHRGGRCGRMGLKGEVISIVSEREEFVVERLANEVGAKVEKLTTIGT